MTQMQLATDSVAKKTGNFLRRKEKGIIFIICAQASGKKQIMLKNIFEIYT